MIISSHPLRAVCDGGPAGGSRFSLVASFRKECNMSHPTWMDDCSVSLLVPNITEVVLSAVIPSPNNPNTTIFLFKHPEDVSSGQETYEQVGFVYTS
ncbi:MAG: hypothetical protein CMH52_03075, partial [Myxococcales bacterium]|nr:hypothetical protein [Myxococcales bacterium]